MVQNTGGTKAPPYTRVFHIVHDQSTLGVLHVQYAHLNILILPHPLDILVYN
jgi:hypothetical protein